jgi:hypothetical protein
VILLINFKLFQKKIDDVFNDKNIKNQYIYDLLNLVSGRKYHYKIPQIVNEIGVNNFLKMLKIIKNDVVELPKFTDFKDDLILAICYYYREIKKMEWTEIKERLPFIIDKDQTITIGIRIKQLKKYINEKFCEILSNGDADV